MGGDDLKAARRNGKCLQLLKDAASTGGKGEGSIAFVGYLCLRGTERLGAVPVVSTGCSVL